MLFNELQKYKKSILKIAAQHHVENVRLFGSVATGQANENSDIDFLVSLGANADLLNLGGFQYDLSHLLEGHKIDIVPEDSIHWYIKDRVLKEARPL